MSTEVYLDGLNLEVTGPAITIAWTCPRCGKRQRMIAQSITPYVDLVCDDCDPMHVMIALDFDVTGSYD